MLEFQTIRRTPEGAYVGLTRCQKTISFTLPQGHSVMALRASLADIRTEKIRAALDLWSRDKNHSMQSAGVACGVGVHAVWNTRNGKNKAAFAKARVARAKL